MYDEKIDMKKLNKCNTHISNLEILLKSVHLTGTYEQFRLAPCLLLFNFIDLLRGVTVLDNHHMVAPCNIIIRSMFEILVDFLYCETDRENLYSRFGEYQNVNRVLLYNKLPKEMKCDVNQDEYQDITLPKYRKFLEKYNIKETEFNKLQNWSGISMSKKVNTIKKNSPEIYNLYLNIYKVNCGYVHTYASTICEYTSLCDTEISLSYEKEYNNDKFSTIRELNSLVELFYDNFKNNYANKSLANITF